MAPAPVRLYGCRGCTLGCPGCYNPKMHPHEPRKLMDPKRLAKDLLTIENSDGLTIMGGEPFQQAQACSVLAENYRRSGKTVMVFSGYTFDQLQRSTDMSVQRFLGQIDILVAGPYIQQKKCEDKLWVSSTNQTIHFLTEKGKSEAESASQNTPTIEVTTDGAEYSLHGFPDAEDLKWFDSLQEQLEQSMDT